MIGKPYGLYHGLQNNDRVFSPVSIVFLLLENLAVVFNDLHNPLVVLNVNRATKRGETQSVSFSLWSCKCCIVDKIVDEFLMDLAIVIGDTELAETFDCGMKDTLQRVLNVVLQESLNRAGCTLKIETY